MPDPIDPLDEDENKCAESASGEHEPDWNSLKVYKDQDTYIDINCKACGRSGCVGSTKTLAENLSW